MVLFHEIKDVCLSKYQEIQFSMLTKYQRLNTDAMVHTSTQEVEAGRLGVQSQPQLQETMSLNKQTNAM